MDKKSFFSHLSFILVILFLGAGVMFLNAYIQRNNDKLQKAGEALIVKNGNDIDVYHIMKSADNETVSISKNLGEYILSAEARKLCLSNKSGIYYSEIERDNSLEELLPLLGIFLSGFLLYAIMSYVRWMFLRWKGKRDDKKYQSMHNAAIG